MDISVIFVSYNTIEMTKVALSHLYASIHSYEMEVFIVDNDSKDHSATILRKLYPNISIIENNKNVGFGRANNQALPYIKGRYVLLLNTDAFVKPDTISKTIQYMEANSRCGILGVRLLGRDGVLQPSCRYFPTPWNIFLSRTGLNRYFKHTKMVDDLTWDHDSVRDCDWVPGCYYLVRKEVIDQVGLFDPRYFLYYEEVDQCYAAKKAGWLVTYFPFSSVVHIGGESAKSEGEITLSGRQIESLQLESELLYFRKNHGFVTVMADVLLTSIFDVIQAIRGIFKPIHTKHRGEYLRHLRLLWKLFLDTGLGQQPTR